MCCKQNSRTLEHYEKRYRHEYETIRKREGRSSAEIREEGGGNESNHYDCECLCPLPNLYVETLTHKGYENKRWVFGTC